MADWKDVVLFFHASWCGTCKKLDENIWLDLEDVANNTVIFKADYDNQALSDAYWIKKQHTLVKLDSTGTVIDTKQWVMNVNWLNAFVN